MTPAETAILDEMRREIRAAMDRAVARLHQLPEPDHASGDCMARGHWDANGSGDWHCIHEPCACLPEPAA